MKIDTNDDVDSLLETAEDELETDSIQAAMFSIVSVRLIDEAYNKFIYYTIQIRHGSARADIHQTQIERRYTDFLQLYENLKKECPDFGFPFPRKAIVGNFSEWLVAERRKKFEAFLEAIAKDTKLRNSTSFLNFLQNRELTSGLAFCMEQRYDSAEPIFKSNFRLLNKVYTDRSPPVLLSLCRLVGAYAAGKTPCDRGQRWAQLALHRFDGVSDVDMLMLYTPLLEACLLISPQDNGHLENRLADMRKRGVYGSAGNTKNLLDATNQLDRIIRKLDPEKV